MLLRTISIFFLLLTGNLTYCAQAVKTAPQKKAQANSKTVAQKKNTASPKSLAKKNTKSVPKQTVKTSAKSQTLKNAKKPLNSKLKAVSKNTAVKKKQVKPSVVKAKKAALQKKVIPKKIVSKKKSTPLVHSVKKQNFQRDRLIILDAGHGGYDLGCRLASCNEKSLALSTTLMTKKYLTEKGYKVILTRSRDVFLTLKKRTQIANDTKSKLFVSIHFNAAKNTSAKGIEVFYYQSKDKWRSNSSKKLAVRVLSKLIDRTGADNRGVKTGNFHVIRETKMPAILVEGGFITHESERTKLKDSNYRAKLARAIAEGIDSYFKL